MWFGAFFEATRHHQSLFVWQARLAVVAVHLDMMDDAVPLMSKKGRRWFCLCQILMFRVVYVILWVFPGFAVLFCDCWVMLGLSKIGCLGLFCYLV